MEALPTALVKQTPPGRAGICHSCHNGSPGNIPQMGATEPLGPKCPDGIETLVTLSNHTFNMFPECKILLVNQPRIFIDDTLSIPGVGGGMLPNLVLGRLTIISLVLRTLSLRLLS